MHQLFMIISWVDFDFTKLIKMQINNFLIKLFGLGLYIYMQIQRHTYTTIKLVQSNLLSLWEQIVFTIVIAMWHTVDCRLSELGLVESTCNKCLNN